MQHIKPISSNNFFIKLGLIRLTSNNGIIKKESVEMFVYLKIGIWRGPNENKQYSTPVQYVE